MSSQVQLQYLSLLSYLKTICIICVFLSCINNGVTDSVLASNAVDHGFEPRSDQTKDYAICICLFSVELAVFMRKSID